MTGLAAADVAASAAFDTPTVCKAPKRNRSAQREGKPSTRAFALRFDMHRRTRGNAGAG